MDKLLDLSTVASTVALATAFAMLGDAVLGFPPLVPLAAAVVVSGALAGRWGAAAAVVLATLCTDFVFVSPRYHWTLDVTALGLGAYYSGAAVAAALLRHPQRSL